MELCFADVRVRSNARRRARVAVVVAGGKTLPRQGVLGSPIGTFYVAEQPDARRPVAVIGYTADGTSAREEI
jgi:hypothetical protein